MQCPALSACCGAGASSWPPKRCTCPACSSSCTLGHHAAQIPELHLALIQYGRATGDACSCSHRSCLHTADLSATSHGSQWPLEPTWTQPQATICPQRRLTFLQLAHTSATAEGSMPVAAADQVDLQLLGRQRSAAGAVAGHETMSWGGCWSRCWNGEGSSPAA